MFFIDGLGIGERSAENPLSQIENVEPLAYFVNEKPDVFLDGVLIPTDPRLGIEGRPQSASGQTTILTGINAPQLLGNHKQGFPNQILREVIAEHSIFLQLKNLKIEPNTFANAYTPNFFLDPSRWKSATTCAMGAAGANFRKLPDLFGRKALFHDFSNRHLIDLGYDAQIFSPSDAGRILADLVEQHRFTLYEYFITDKIGHAQDFEKAAEYLPLLAEFIRELLGRIDLETTTVILTSDHGNIENLAIRNHTLNDVPTVVWGRKRFEIAERIVDLSDITPTIISLLDE